MNERAKKLVQNTSTKDDAPIQEVPLACADEKAAVEFMEKQRWGDAPCCPECGSVSVYQMKDSKTGERQKNFRWRCHDCKKQYTVRVGTVFEDSRIPLRHWCYGFYRASTSKKGVSALEIKRQTGLAYKSALFMLNRIRFAMDESDVEPLEGIVEVDETFVGGKARRKNNQSSIKNRGEHQAQQMKRKQPVIGMLERNGKIRPRVIADVTAKTLKAEITKHIDQSATIMTDDWTGYRFLAREGWKHDSVNHSRYEFARGDVTTNRIEGFFSILKRGLNGIYHSVSKKHLHRYLSEFEFRYNHKELTDGERLVMAIKSANNKRITYQQILNAE